MRTMAMPQQAKRPGIKNHEKQEKDGIIKPEIVKLVNVRLKRAVDIIDNVEMNARR